MTGQHLEHPRFQRLRLRGRAIAKIEQQARLAGRDSLTRFELAEADHTFSRRVWREAVAERVLGWMNTLR